jgi:(p)ppGpp synthase/HD superfamily hydrolase
MGAAYVASYGMDVCCSLLPGEKIDGLVVVAPSVYIHQGSTGGRLHYF